ncbi:ATG C terminal domain-containing protein, partial [Entophlyctis helioformis]
PLSVFLLHECNIIWRLYDGSHWDFDEDSFRSHSQASRKSSQSSLVPDDASMGAHSMTGSDRDTFAGIGGIGGGGVGVSGGGSTHGTKRFKDHELEIRLVRLGVRWQAYPPANADVTTELDLTVRDVEIIDNVKTSQWRKFFAYMQPESNMLPRETNSDMLLVKLRGVPQPSGDQEFRLQASWFSSTECASLLPFRMYIDQDTLKFVIRFASETAELRQISQPVAPASPTGAAAPTDNTFFQLCEIDPISMKIDYKPKHVDFTSLKDGKFIEFLNFIHLDSAELSLHRIRLAGVKGWDNLGRRIASIWLPHIRDTQVPNVASGVSSVRPLVNIGSGLADLVLLPVEQFRKDGRIIKGLQKGTGAFLKAATMETIRLGSRVAAGTQVILERAEEFVARPGGGSGSAMGGYGGASSSSSASTHSVSGGAGYGGPSGSNMGGPSGYGGGSSEPGASRRQFSKFSDQPKDIREGLQMGYASLSEGVRSAARTIFAVPTDVYETNDDGRIHPVVRAVPVAILQPIIGATDAVSKTLVGLQNSLDPTQQRRMEDKYKRQG